MERNVSTASLIRDYLFAFVCIKKSKQLNNSKNVEH